MNNLSKKFKITSIFVAVFAGFAGIILAVYLWLLPYVVSNDSFVDMLEQKAQTMLGVNLTIENPELHTNLTPVLTFKVNKIGITKGDEKLFLLEKLNSSLSFRDILLKRIIVKRLSIEGFYADVNKLMALCPKQEKKQPQKMNWYVDVMDALIYARNLEILYDVDKTTNIHILSKGVGTNNAKKHNRRVYFDFLLTLKHNGENIRVSVNDQAKVKIDKKTLYIDDLPVIVNNSRLFVKAIANRKIKYDLTVYSKNFDMQNVVSLIDSNLLVPNGREMLAYVANNINGNFDFSFKFHKRKLNGCVTLNRLTSNIVFLNNLPVVLTGGNIKIDNNKIVLNDFKGYYCNSPDKNKIVFNGDIKDYMKSFEMNIVADTFLTDEFTRDYFSKMIGCPISLVGDAGTRVIVKSKNNKFDILGYTRLLPGEDILVDGMSLTPKNYERILKADLHFEDMLLKIKGVDYFIGAMQEGAKDFKRKSVMVLSGNFDCKSLRILDMGIRIPDPLPSEFFNLFAGPKFFRKGTVKGYIHVDNRFDIPVLYANMKAHGVRVPRQRLKINDANIVTDKNHIHINAQGRFKRSAYKFDGNITNRLTLPMVVNNVNLTVDNMDLAKLLESFNQQNTSAVTAKPAAGDDDDDDNDDAYVFNTGLLVVNDCNLNLIKGNFNDIKVGNLHAVLTLDKNGLLQVHSNKFDFAEGISTLKLKCDLMKHQYYVRLGVKDVNSDLLATSLLNLSKEISGKAKGLIEINTDDSLKLNGKILFEIDNGTIGKVGFLEYVLKFAALFRNPMAMLSPSTFVDLVTIPDGNFDNIKGELYLKDNVINLIKIKSRAPHLSSFIIGCFNLESRDAILRIYTKMTGRYEGFYGVLRNISLNTLANRLSLGSSNEANYYAAEIKQLPELDVPDKYCQIFLTKLDGDVEHNNFISSLKRIK